jgi:hypothetical protein
VNPPNLLEALDFALQAIEGGTPAPGAWLFLDMASRHINLGDERLTKLASLSAVWSPVRDTAKAHWHPLMHLARAAASQRAVGLSDAILRTIRASPDAGEEPGTALQIALAASAAWAQIDEAMSQFAETTLALAWRANRAGCAEIETVLNGVAAGLPVSASWRLSLARSVAELGARARAG